jgi:NADH:ubiquinone oxidoreductase subunit 6 (subunit J)
MNRSALIPGLVLALAIMVLFAVTAFSSEWFTDMNAGEFNPIQFVPGPEGLGPNSINLQLFENYGPLLLVLALLMFGAILGGVYIAREDDDDDSD